MTTGAGPRGSVDAVTDRRRTVVQHGVTLAVAALVFMTAAWAVGLLIRYPVQRARSAEEHATRVEREQADAARRAVLEERRRIARELHDVVAHSVSVMTVQTGGVRRLLRPDQEREREALL